MAGLALHLGMFSGQRVLGVLVVIESGRLPAPLVMAALAFVSQAPLVALIVIVLAMTTHAGQRQLLLIQGSLVARSAFRLVMFSLQAEAGLDVIKGGWIPSLGSVAITTFLAEAAFVAILVVCFAMA